MSHIFEGGDELHEMTDEGHHLAAEFSKPLTFSRRMNRGGRLNLHAFKFKKGTLKTFRHEVDTRRPSDMVREVFDQVKSVSNSEQSGCKSPASSQYDDVFISEHFHRILAH